MSSHIVSIKTYVVIFLALMVFLLLTILAAHFNLGRWSLIIALAIAATKASLVILYFMHIRYSSPLSWVFAGAGILWLGIMFVLGMSDYFARGWVPGVGGR